MTAADAREPLTRSIEDYLKAIYSLSSPDAAAATNDIATHLNLTPASVSGMIKRLSGQGLVEHSPYRGTRLTHEGKLLALRMLRRHRLIEAYLVAFLDYTWDNVHEEAERLEHAVSDELIERMAHALGNPRVDPHGDPIPDADGNIADFIHVPLSDVEPGETVTIARVDSRDEDRLRFLAVEGLVPGTEVAVVDRYPYGGPVTVRVAGEDRMVGRELAAIILCSR